MWNNFTHFRKEIDDFVNRIHAESLAIAENLADMKASGKTGDYVMESRAWKSQIYAYIRMTHLRGEGRVEMLNFTIYPRTDYELPMFASDLVLLQEQFRVIVIDAMPVYPNDSIYYEKYIKPFEPAYTNSLQLGEEYVRKKDWSFEFLSDKACLRHKVESRHIADVLTIWKQYLSIYEQLGQQAQPISALGRKELAAWQTKYDKKHLAVELERNPLMHYFGKEMGERYQKEFLFRG